tara:strand:+ start:301 stop:972 length:672 start_codon:yes stop_codon:yes gene_type:complete
MLRPSTDIAKELILLECYATEVLKTEAPTSEKRNDVGRIKQKYAMTSSITRDAYRSLQTQGFIYPESSTGNVLISTRGVRFVEELLLSQKTFDEVVLKSQRDLASELAALASLNSEDDDEESFPASKKTQEIDAETSATGIKKLDEVIRAISGSNEKGQNEKAEAIRDLEQGKILLDGHKIKKTLLVAVILSPLYQTYLTFAEENIRTLATRAIEWFQKALGY